MIDRGDLYFLAVFFVSQILIAVGQRYYPMQRDIFTVTGFAIMFGWLFIQSYYFLWKTAPYQYIRADVFPSGRVLHLFAKDVDTERIHGIPNMYRTKLELAFPYKDKFYGKVDEVAIKHDYPRTARINFQPGIALYHGIQINHPNVEKAVLYEDTVGGFDADFDRPIPSFTLAHASGDKDLGPIASPQIIHVKGKNPGRGMVVVPRRWLQKKLKDLTEYRSAVAGLKGQVSDHQTEEIKFAEVMEKKSAQTMGLLKAGGEVKDMVVALFLHYLQAYQKIDTALKMIQGPRYGIGRWVAIPIVVGLVVAYLWASPQTITQAQQWLSAWQNQVFVLIGLAILGGTLYYLKRRRR